MLDLDGLDGVLVDAPAPLVPSIAFEDLVPEPSVVPLTQPSLPKVARPAPTPVDAAPALPVAVLVGVGVVVMLLVAGGLWAWSSGEVEAPASEAVAVVQLPEVAPTPAHPPKPSRRPRSNPHLQPKHLRPLPSHVGGRSASPTTPGTMPPTWTRWPARQLPAPAPFVCVATAARSVQRKTASWSPWPVPRRSPPPSRTPGCPPTASTGPLQPSTHPTHFRTPGPAAPRCAVSRSPVTPTHPDAWRPPWR